MYTNPLYTTCNCPIFQIIYYVKQNCKIIILDIFINIHNKKENVHLKYLPLLKSIRTSFRLTKFNKRDYYYSAIMIY